MALGIWRQVHMSTGQIGYAQHTKNNFLLNSDSTLSIYNFV